MRLLVLFLLLCTVVNAGFFDFLFGRKKTAPSTPAPAAVSDDKAKSYLQSFGYIGPSNAMASSPRGGAFKEAFRSASQTFTDAIRKFQQFAGLRETGQLDDSTRTKMAAPRCGIADVQAISTNGAADFKWSKTRLTYSIENYTPDISRADVRKAIADAYGTWAAVSPLTFTEVSPGTESDIKVRFGSGNHNDPWPFDGKGGVLAHATMPENGALHFDEDENWVYMDAEKIASQGYTDIFAVAIHEAGHTLGLQHSKDQTSIMAPFYHETVDSNGNYIKPTLKSNDIYELQNLYGRGHGSVTAADGGLKPTESPHAGSHVDIPSGSGGGGSTRWGGSGGSGGSTRWGGSSGGGRTTTTTHTPDFGSGGSTFGGRSGGGSCPVTVDAFTVGDKSKYYLFSSSRVYEIDSSKNVVNTYSLSQLFPSGPSYVQAAVYNPVNGIMLLFQGRQVYGFYYSSLRGRYTLDSEYPKRLPSDIDFVPNGALRWVNGHQILLGDNGNFAVYDEYWNQSTMKNRIASYFPNLPNGVKGIFQPSGDYVVGFTLTKAFEYNVRTKSTNSQMRYVLDVIHCSR